MVAEGGVPRHRQPLGLERPAGRVEQPRDHREAALAARHVVGLARRGAVRVPVVRVVVGRVVVVRRPRSGSRSPESTRTCPPSSRSMFQRISLSWELSELSPVWIASASGLPVTGPAAIVLSWRTIASAIWPESISCGRYAEVKIPVLGSGRRVVEPVGPLHAQRRLGVDDVHVGELGERDQRLAARWPAGARRTAEVGADQVRLAGRLDDRVGSPRRPRCRGPGSCRSVVRAAGPVGAAACAGTKTESAAAAGPEPAAAAAPPATAPERNRPRRVSFTAGSTTGRDHGHALTPSVHASLPPPSAVVVAGVPSVTSHDGRTVACPGRLGVVPPADQRRHQLRTSRARAPGRRGARRRAGRADRPGDVRRVPRCAAPGAPRCRSTETSGSGWRPGPGCAR